MLTGAQLGSHWREAAIQDDGRAGGVGAEVPGTLPRRAAGKRGAE